MPITKMPQGPHDKTSQERNVPGPRQVQPATVLMIPACLAPSPVSATPSPLDSHYLHPRWTGHQTGLTIRHTTQKGQDKNAKQHQDVQSNLNKLNNRALCSTLHESQPRDSIDLGYSVSCFAGWLKSIMGRQIPFLSPFYEATPSIPPPPMSPTRYALHSHGGCTQRLSVRQREA